MAKLAGSGFVPVGFGIVNCSSARNDSLAGVKVGRDARAVEISIRGFADIQSAFIIV